LGYTVFRCRKVVHTGRANDDTVAKKIGVFRGEFNGTPATHGKSGCSSANSVY
jgi:hypothetical protein